MEAEERRNYQQAPCFFNIFRAYRRKPLTAVARRIHLPASSKQPTNSKPLLPWA